MQTFFNSWHFFYISVFITFKVWPGHMRKTQTSERRTGIKLTLQMLKHNFGFCDFGILVIPDFGESTDDATNKHQTNKFSLLPAHNCSLRLKSKTI